MGSHIGAPLKGREKLASESRSLQSLLQDKFRLGPGQPDCSVEMVSLERPQACSFLPPSRRQFLLQSWEGDLPS